VRHCLTTRLHSGAELVVFYCRNVPRHGGYMYSNGFAPRQQPQAQVAHSRHGPPQGPLPPPPLNMPVQPPLPSGYASVPRAFVPHQQGAGYVNSQVNGHSRPAFPEVFTQVHPNARAPPHTTQTPPCGFANLGGPGGQEPPPYSLEPASQSLTPRGVQPYGRPSSGGSYELVHPPVFETPPPQTYVSQTA
jgi:hypothetical protein